MVDTARQSTVVRLPHAEFPLDIAEAKLLRPPRRRGTVNRPALVDRLIDSSTIPMIAIIAPAGYGKTTLLSDWAERDGRPFAWVSVDEGDVDPVVFLSHVAVALDRVEELDADVFRAIASPAPPTPAARFADLAPPSRGAPARSSWCSTSSTGRTSRFVSTRSLRWLRTSPEGSAIAIAARTVPNVGLPRFRADGRLLGDRRRRPRPGPRRSSTTPPGRRVPRDQDRGRGAHRGHRGVAGRPLPGGVVAPATGAIRGAADPFHRRGPVHRRLRPLGGLEASLEGSGNASSRGPRSSSA